MVEFSVFKINHHPLIKYIQESLSEALHQLTVYTEPLLIDYRMRHGMLLPIPGKLRPIYIQWKQVLLTSKMICKFLAMHRLS
jgi:hypothetical protein